jgi:hypothetical protein
MAVFVPFVLNHWQNTAGRSEGQPNGTPAGSLLFAVTLASWMELFVHRSEIFPIDVGVYLCVREVGMTQHFLHCPEIRSSFEEMGCEGMP